MKLQQRFLLILAAVTVRFIYSFSRLLNLGSGSNLPGKIVLKLFPDLLKILVPRFKYGWILITGTNGKTTTTKILVQLIEEYKFRVVTNSQGANLISGILTSILLPKLNLAEPFMADYAVFEIDEAVLAKSFNLFRPRLLVVTNFSRDQLDRYGEVDTNVTHIIELLKNTNYPCKVLLNGNDPNMIRIGSVVAPENRIYFGIKEEGTTPETGFLIETEAGKDSGTGLSIPKLDLWAEKIHTHYLNGSRFQLNYQNISLEIYLELPGVYNILNALAAAAVCSTEIDNNLTRLAPVLADVKPSFGRSEHFIYRGLPVFMFLVKNPVGFNHILRLLAEAESNKRIMLILTI
jgi:lipid II isoglutaminyl synthase (glutamine-hydrolysing)